MQLNKIKNSANTLLGLNKFEEAFNVYSIITENIFAAIEHSNSALTGFIKNFPKKNSNDLFDLKEKYQLKIFENYCDKKFGLSVDLVKNEFELSLLGELKSISRSNTLSASIPKDLVFAKTFLLQNLIIEDKTSFPAIVSKVFTLVNENDITLKVKPNFTTDYISNQIIKNSEFIMETDYSESNTLLLDYLLQIGDTDSKLFTELKIKTNYNFKYRQKSKTHSKTHSNNDYEKYERYEKYEFYEKYERRKYDNDEIDLSKATEYEKANYFGKLFKLKGRVTKSQIRKTYIDLINKYHPDKVSNLGDELKELAERKTKLINIAYEYFKKKYNL